MRRIRTLSAGAALALALVSCAEEPTTSAVAGGGNGGSSTTAPTTAADQGAGGGTPTTTPPENPPPTDPPPDDPAGDQPTEQPTTTSAGGPEPNPTDPGGPDFSIYTVPECAIVLDERGPGQDTLNVFFQLRSNGPTFPPGFFGVYAYLDRGVETQVFASAGDPTAFEVVQLPINGGHYGGEAFLSITADPDNEVVERDERNNSTTVRIPDLVRPLSSGDDIPCELA